MLKHKKYVQKQLHKSLRFLHKIYTLFLQPFNGFENIFDGYFSQKRYISPSQCCYSIGLHNPLIAVPVQGYLMLVDRVNLVFLVLKEPLLSIYCFTIKKAGLVVIKSKFL